MRGLLLAPAPAVSALETIAGWGTTSEGGDAGHAAGGAGPDTTDAYCSGANSDFDASTMVCAGFEQGGVEWIRSVAPDAVD
jgi:trypsin